MKKICVLGLGYIGLPTAAMFATHGFEVMGVDVNERVVDALNNGEVHIHEPGLETLVQYALKSGNLRIARQPEFADAFIICVPTPFIETADRAKEKFGQPVQSVVPFKQANLSYVVAAAESIVPCLRPGNLVVLESTVPPRTTVDVLVPILEHSGLLVSRGVEEPGSIGAEEQNRKSKRDCVSVHLHSSTSVIYLAHCPERVLPGRILEELVHNDRVIGGIDRASAEMAKALYASFVQGEIFLTDATTAEMVKLMENTYRDVNIALANEFALVAEKLGINIWEAIELANRHPRVSILRPGPGVGGHCIAVDPWFIVQVAPEITPLIQTARRVNDGMPAHVVKMVKRALAEQRKSGAEKHRSGGSVRIACLGLAYKADVGDIRESPAIRVIELLRTEGFEVRAYDPYVPMGAVPEQVESLEAALNRADVVVVLTDHNVFKASAKAITEQCAEKAIAIIDTRNALRTKHSYSNDKKVQFDIP